MTIMYNHTDHATEFTPDGQTTVTCSRYITNPDMALMLLSLLVRPVPNILE